MKVIVSVSFICCRLNVQYNKFGTDRIPPVRSLTANMPKTMLICFSFLDTLHLVLVSHTMYTLLITNFGNLLTLTETIWSLQACYASHL